MFVFLLMPATSSQIFLRFAVETASNQSKRGDTCHASYPIARFQYNHNADKHSVHSVTKPKTLLWLRIPPPPAARTTIAQIAVRRALRVATALHRPTSPSSSTLRSRTFTEPSILSSRSSSRRKSRPAMSPRRYRDPFQSTFPKHISVLCCTKHKR